MTLNNRGHALGLTTKHSQIPAEVSTDSKDPHRDAANTPNTLSSLTSSLARAIVPKTADGFVTYLFWHSMLLTASTPLYRVFRGRWMGGASSVNFASNTLRRHLDVGRSCAAPDNYAEEFLHNWGDRGIATMVCREETGGKPAHYYRVAQLNFTQEIEVLCMLFDRSLSICTVSSIKKHI